jgi:hypothetical protein
MMDYRKGSILIIIDDHTFNPFEQTIEKVTGDGHHTANYIGIDGTITEAHFGSGVTYAHISKYYSLDKRVLVLEPRLDVFSAVQIEVVCQRWLDDVGMKYDNISAIAKKFPVLRHFSSGAKRICSEHTAMGYRNIHSFMGKEPEDVTPNDILRDQLYCGFRDFKPIWLVW